MSDLMDEPSGLIVKTLKNPLMEFRKQIRKNGLYKDTKFLVRMVPPFALRETRWNGGDDLRLLSMFARNAAIPGAQMATADTNFSHSRQVAYRNVFAPLDMSFYMSRDLRERQFFGQWQNAMVDRRTNLGLNYYKDYVSDMFVYTFSDVIDPGGLSFKRVKDQLVNYGKNAIRGVLDDLTNIDGVREIARDSGLIDLADSFFVDDVQVTSISVFKDVFPVSVSDVNLNVDNMDTFSTLNVNLSYRYFKFFVPTPEAPE